MPGKLLVIAAGGTAGHMFPAQALAEAWLKTGGRVVLSTDARGARYTQNFPDAVTVDVLPSATFARGGVIAKLLVPFKVLGGIAGGIARLRRMRPAVVVGFGGYPSIPAVAAAIVLRLPRVLHEQNGVLGRVNQLFVKRVNVLACGTWPTHMPKGVEGEFTGNPVRASIRTVAGAPYAVSATGALNVVVFGGSQGSRIVSDRAAEALIQLPEVLRSRLNVVHQARPEDEERTAALYKDAGVTAQVMPFISDMADRLVAAHLVICRSGASSVADVAAIGRPAIFVPLAIAIRDEQTANGRAMLEAGGAVVIQEADLSAEHLAKEVAAILENPERARAMAEASKGCGRPDAVEALLDITQKLAQKD